MATWIKTNVTTSAAVTLFLLALSPIGHMGKGIAHILALATAVQAVRESQLLIVTGARQHAITAMNRELESVDLALQAYTQEQALREVYGLTPEVREEVNQSLEHLMGEPAANNPHETSTSTSRKELYMAVVNLLASGKSESYIIEEVLGFKGRRFKEGQKVLQELLQEGKENEW